MNQRGGQGCTLNSVDKGQRTAMNYVVAMHIHIYMPERKIDTDQLKILDMRKAGAGIATFLFLLFCVSIIFLLCSYAQYIKCSLVHRPLHSLVHYI